MTGRPGTGPSPGRHASRLVALSLLAGMSIGSTQAPALEHITDFGENPGLLDMFVHLPSQPRTGSDDGLPLVVALHGCRQSAAQFDDETGLVALAETTPFVLLLPQQREENQWRRCFRWYDRNDNRPAMGESASIAGMIDEAIQRFDIDPDRIYVLGLSAGGAMTAVMLANYPDRFAGGAIIAGVPFDCNRPASAFDGWWYTLHYNPFVIDGSDASYACGIVGYGAPDRAAEVWGDFVRSVAGTTPQKWPLVSIWHGTGDRTVDPDNLGELVEQWTDVHGIDAVADEEDRVGRATRRAYHDADGHPRVEAWIIDGFAHAVPIDEDGDPDPCGMSADYIENADLCAVRRAAEFWRLAK